MFLAQKGEYGSATVSNRAYRSSTASSSLFLVPPVAPPHLTKPGPVNQVSGRSCQPSLGGLSHARSTADSAEYGAFTAEVGVEPRLRSADWDGRMCWCQSRC